MDEGGDGAVSTVDAGPAELGGEIVVRPPQPRVDVDDGAVLPLVVRIRGEIQERYGCAVVAVGASRGRLVRQMLAESGLLAALGGAGGLVLTAIGIRLLAPLLPVIGSYTDPSPQIDYRVLAFTVAAVLLTTLLFGLLPAVRTTRTDMLRVAASPGGWSAGRALLVVELALSVMLLGGAALLGQSLWNLQGVDAGFRPDRLLTMQVWLPERKYPSPASVQTFSDDVLQRVESLPGVRSVSTVNTRPFLGWFLGLQVEVPGYIPPETMEGGGMLTYRVVSDRYFETLGAELVEGRAFSTGDRPAGAPVTVVNEAAAARYWPEAEPIGRQLRPRFQPGAAPWIPEGRADWFTVVGVVRDFREHQIEEPAVPVIYLSQRQNPSRLMNLMVSTQGPATSVASAVQREIRAVDGDLGVYDLKTMDTILSDVVALPRFNALLIWLFAALALSLSAIGVHGVTSHLVALRTREFAIRIAVGAQPGKIFRTVALETAWVGAAGILVGLAGSLLLRAHDGECPLRGRGDRRNGPGRRVRRGACRGPLRLLSPGADGDASRSDAGPACRVRRRTGASACPARIADAADVRRGDLQVAASPAGRRVVPLSWKMVGGRPGRLARRQSRTSRPERIGGGTARWDGVAGGAASPAGSPDWRLRM